MATLMVAPTSGCPYAAAKVTGRWPDPSSGALEAAVCSAVFKPRRFAPPPLGSPLVLITPSGTVTVKITAVIDFDETVQGFPTAFTTVGTMRQAGGDTYDPQPNLLLCHVRDGGVAKAIKEVVAKETRLAQRSSLSVTEEDGRDASPRRPPGDGDLRTVRGTVPTADSGLSVVDRKEVESRFSSDKLQNFKRQAPLLLTLSVLTALCMLINALTVGVEQKLRVLALLRAAGMTTRQVAHMVMLEGAVIASVGWAVGLLAGWAILSVFVRRTPDAFPEGAVLGWVTPVCSAVGVALITALSLHWPCRRAMRIRPLDVLVDGQADEKTRPV